jgi:DNA-binding transcriptional LysR family regulator
LIFRDGPRQTAGYVERVLRARGVVSRDALRLPHTESVKQAALAGLGVAVLPGVAVADDLATGRLRKLTVAGLRLTRAYHVAERERPSRAMRAFACVLKHAVRGSLPAVRVGKR